MVKILNYILITVFVYTAFTCKRNTTIKVKVYNYALAEPVANAKVVVVERKESGLFTSNTSCKEITSAITDINGECYFNKEKLKTGDNIESYLALSEIYGKAQAYPCGGKTSGFLSVGEANEKTLEAGMIPAYFKVQLNNFLTPSQTNDSFFISINTPKYQVPGSQYPVGGGGVFFKSGNQPGGGYASPLVISDIVKSNAGKNTVHIRKRKMGVVTTTVDTVKIYPYETKIIEINW